MNKFDEQFLDDVYKKFTGQKADGRFYKLIKPTIDKILKEGKDSRIEFIQFLVKYKFIAEKIKKCIVNSPNVNPIFLDKSVFVVYYLVNKYPYKIGYHYPLPKTEIDEIYCDLGMDPDKYIIN